jgi:8-oxo-dGTP pyrophosphatase MutT (NUDIX family)
MSIGDDELRRALEPASEDWRSHPKRRDAAVLIPWLTRGDQDLLLYTRRRKDLASHAGEISFPGGGREGDEGARQCALREAAEEIGLPASCVTVLGQLPERPSIGGYQVHAFVARVVAPPILVPDPAEVEAILEIPLAELRDTTRWEFHELDSPLGLRRKIPFFDRAGRNLWGLTARFTLDLLERLP